MADNRVDIIVAVKDMASTPLKALADATKSYNSTLRALSGSANQVTSTIRNLFLAFGGYTVIKDAISTGYKFNSTIEETRVGIASLIFSMNTFRDSSGRVAAGTDAFNVALYKSKDVQDELRIAGLKTAATYEQLTKAYSQSYVPAIKAGFDESQIVKFTTAATQAATAMRVPPLSLRRSPTALQAYQQ